MESFQNNYRRINGGKPFVRQDSAGTVIREENRKTNPHYFLFAEFQSVQINFIPFRLFFPFTHCFVDLLHWPTSRLCIQIPTHLVFISPFLYVLAGRVGITSQ